MRNKKQANVRPEIRGVSGAFAGRGFPMPDRKAVTIGRDEEQCGLVIVADEISRRHCTVEYHNLTDMYKVTDYSSNGTYVDERRRLLKEETRLLPRGAVLSIGTHENRVRLC